MALVQIYTVFDYYVQVLVRNKIITVLRRSACMRAIDIDKLITVYA